jgi:uncharacterized C2H2 Zn-finger protein
MRKKCPQCGALFVGRSDKKFCGDYCRNSFNNKVHPEIKKMIRNTNNRLKKNYKILVSLNVSGKTKIPKSKLTDRGFYPELVTSFYTTKAGNTYYYVYDQGYLWLENETVLLIRKSFK